LGTAISDPGLDGDVRRDLRADKIILVGFEDLRVHRVRCRLGDEVEREVHRREHWLVIEPIGKHEAPRRRRE